MAQLFYIADLQVGPGENEAMNRYFYYNPDADVTATNVGLSFADNIVELARMTQSSAWEHVALYVNDVLNPGNSSLITMLGWIGARGPSSLPASNSWSFPMKPYGPQMKRGGKRLVGPSEADTELDIYSGSVILGLLTAYALGLILPLDVGTSNLVHVVARELPSGTEWLISAITGAIYRQVGTQVSRKLSRGGGTSIGSQMANTFSSTTATDISAYTDIQLQSRADGITDALQLLTPNFTTETTVS